MAKSLVPPPPMFDDDEPRPDSYRDGAVRFNGKLPPPPVFDTLPSLRVTEPVETEEGIIVPKEVARKRMMVLPGMEVSARERETPLTAKEILSERIQKELGRLPQGESIPDAYSRGRGAVSGEYGGRPAPVQMTEVPKMVTEMINPSGHPLVERVRTGLPKIARANIGVVGGVPDLGDILEAVNAGAGVGMEALMSGTPAGTGFTLGQRALERISPTANEFQGKVLSPFQTFGKPVGEEAKALAELGDLIFQTVMFGAVHKVAGVQGGEGAGEMLRAKRLASSIKRKVEKGQRLSDSERKVVVSNGGEEILKEVESVGARARGKNRDVRRSELVEGMTDRGELPIINNQLSMAKDDLVGELFGRIEKEFNEATRNEEPFNIGKYFTKETAELLRDDPMAVERMQKLDDVVRRYNSVYEDVGGRSEVVGGEGMGAGERRGRGAEESLVDRTKAGIGTAGDVVLPEELPMVNSQLSIINDQLDKPIVREPLFDESGKFVDRNRATSEGTPPSPPQGGNLPYYVVRVRDRKGRSLGFMGDEGFSRTRVGARKVSAEELPELMKGIERQGYKAEEMMGYTTGGDPSTSLRVTGDLLSKVLPSSKEVKSEKLKIKSDALPSEVVSGAKGGKKNIPPTPPEIPIQSGGQALQRGSNTGERLFELRDRINESGRYKGRAADVTELQMTAAKTGKYIEQDRATGKVTIKDIETDKVTKRETSWLHKPVEDATLLEDLSPGVRERVQLILDEAGEDLDVSTLNLTDLRKAVQDLKTDHGKEATGRAQLLIGELLKAQKEGVFGVVQRAPGVEPYKVGISVDEVLKEREAKAEDLMIAEAERKGLQDETGDVSFEFGGNDPSTSLRVTTRAREPRTVAEYDARIEEVLNDPDLSEKARADAVGVLRANRELLSFPEEIGTQDDLRSSETRGRGGEVENRASERIADFGEKIGGARKDVAKPLGKRGTKVVDTRPAWQRKYVVLENKNNKWEVAIESNVRGMLAQVIRKEFESKAEAEAALPMIELSRHHRVYNVSKSGDKPDYAIVRVLDGGKKTPVIKKGFANEKEAMEYMAKHPKEIIEHKFEFPVRPWLDRIERAGTEHLKGNVTTKMFQDKFGFRGGEFGNWNMGGDGQQVLNHAYNALLDLAETLNVPPKALSLDGKLAIAFGARGHGGKDAAAAHYEPKKAVINLTKIKGAGSLAHEWFHALDHYLGKFDEKRDFESVAATYGYGSKKMGKQLYDAFKKVVETIHYRMEDVKVDESRATSMFTRAKEDVSSELRGLRESLTRNQSTYNKRWKAPTEEQLKRWDELSNKIKEGELGEKINVKNEQAIKQRPRSIAAIVGRDSYENIEAMNQLYKEITGRAMIRQDGGVGMYLAGKVENYLRQKERVGQAEQGAVEKRQRRTEFYHNARDIDMYRSSDYYTLPHEMGARAFESYIFDKTMEGKRRSDYLVYGVENKYYPGMKPYPEGAERAVINKAFDGLIDAIKSSEEYAPTWKEALLESKRRLDETGGLNVGLSVGDVSKHPKVSMATHEKIAYVLEPLIEVAKQEAVELIKEGKLKVEEYSSFIRRKVEEYLDNNAGAEARGGAGAGENDQLSTVNGQLSIEEKKYLKRKLQQKTQFMRYSERTPAQLNLEKKLDVWEDEARQAGLTGQDVYEYSRRQAIKELYGNKEFAGLATEQKEKVVKMFDTLQKVLSKEEHRKEFTGQMGEPYQEPWLKKFLKHGFYQSNKVLSRMGEGGKELSERIQKAEDMRRGLMGEASVIAYDMTKLSKAEYENLTEIRHALRFGTTPPDVLTKRVGELDNRITYFYNKRAEQFQERGFLTKDAESSEMHLFTPLKNYEPRKLKYHLTDLMPKRDKNGNVINSAKREEVLEGMVKAGSAVNKAEAAKILDEFIGKSRVYKAGNIEYSRRLGLPEELYVDDPMQVLLSYAGSTSKRLAEADMFGKDYSIASRLKDKLRDDGYDYDFAEKLFRYQTGELTRAEHDAMKFINAAKGWQAVTKFTPFTTLRNAMQGFLSSTTRGNLRAGAMGLAKAFASEAKRNAYESGALADHVESLIMKEFAGENTWAGKYLKAIGFTQTDAFNRIISSAAGEVFYKDMLKRLTKETPPFVPPQGGNLGVWKKRAVREFEKMGLNVDEVVKRGEFTPDEMNRIRRTFAGDAQFNIKPSDLPLFWSSPTGKLVNQWKAFSYKMTQLLNQSLIKEAKAGNYFPIATMLSAYGVAGETVNNIIDYIRGVFDGDFKGKRMKKRALWSGKPEDGIGWRLIEDLAGLGALSFFVDILRTLGWGKGGVVSWVVGPTVSETVQTVGDIFTPMGQVLTEHTTDNFLKNTGKGLYRTGMRNIPGAGIMRTTGTTRRIEEKFFDDRKEREKKKRWEKMLRELSE